MAQSVVNALLHTGMPALQAKTLDSSFVAQGEATTITSTLTVSGTLNVTGGLEIGGVSVASSAIEMDSRNIAFRIDNVSTADTVYVPVPYAGMVIGVYTALGATISSAAAILTVKDPAGNTMGTVTIAAASTPGTGDNRVTLSNATVSKGDVVSIATNGGSTGAAEVWGQLLVRIT